jgi:integrase
LAPTHSVIPAHAGIQSETRYPEPGTRNPSPLSPIIHFIAYTGLRPSDACNLTTDRLVDLDTDAPAALITQQKTGRLIPIALSPPALDAIRQALRPGTRNPEPGTRLIFLDRRGHPIHPRTISRALEYHSRRLGLPKITAKTLRQMIVTSLYDAGIDPQMVAQITGHRSRAIEAYRKIRHGAPHKLAAAYADILTQDTPTT